jgi:hypothetical protein
MMIRGIISPSALTGQVERCPGGGYYVLMRWFDWLLTAIFAAVLVGAWLSGALS